MLTSDSNEKGPKLLLLFGTSRSGTSWLGKVLDSHPLTLYKHEPDRSGFGIPLVPDVDDYEKYRDVVERFVAQLAGNNTSHCAARLPVFRKQYRSPIADPVHRLSVVASGAASSLGWKFPVVQCARVDSKDVRLVWKSTDSLARLGVILRIVDDCRAIRIIRHPCGYIASIMRGEAQRKFVAAVPASEDYGVIEALIATSQKRRRGLTVSHLRQLHPVERLAWIWVLMNEKVEDDTRTDPRCTSLRYEDVCRDPVNRIRELFSFLALDWNEQTSAFIRASTLTASPAALNRITQDSQRYYSIFRNPLHAAERWKSQMKQDDVKRVFAVLRESDLIRLYPESEQEGTIQPQAS